MQSVSKKKLVFNDDVRKKILSGSQKVYDAVASAYGVVSGNVLLEMQFGDPIISHDGVTIARNINLKDPIENMAAQLILQASNQSNKVAGDGTSCTVILTHHIIEQAYKAIAAGENPIQLRNRILRSADKVISNIENIAMEVKDKDLDHVAGISAGDPELGKLIAKAIIAVGKDGGVSILDSPGLGVESELVDGFHFESGMAAAAMATDTVAMKAEHTNVPILVTDKPLRTAKDVAPILTKIFESDNKKVLIIGEVTDVALALLIENKIRTAAVDSVSVMPPVFGGMRSEFLEDVAIMTGAKLFTQGSEFTDFELSDLGMAESITVTQETTTILGGAGDLEEIELRKDAIKKRIETEENSVRREQLEKRLNKLAGKVAVIKVGGATEIEQKEMKYRVEDAVLATQAARAEGIVPGGATTIIFAADDAEVHDSVRKAALEPFKQLTSNAGFNSEYLLQELLDKGDIGSGYNVASTEGRKMVNLFEAGVIDPAKVIKQVVQNACSIAAQIITTTCAVTIIPEDSKDATPSN